MSLWSPGSYSSLSQSLSLVEIQTLHCKIDSSAPLAGVDTHEHHTKHFVNVGLYYERVGP